MKKILTTFGAFIFLLVPSLAFASSVTITPNPADNGWSVSTTEFTFTQDLGGDSCTRTIWYDQVTQLRIASGLGNFTTTLDGLGYTSNENGTAYFLMFNQYDSDWENVASGAANTPTLAMASSAYCGVSYGLVLGTPAPPPPDTGLPAQIAAAEAGMASTTGFNIGSVISWSGDNLLKVFIGSGVGVLYGLRYWLVALLIISLVALFAFRGMRFFRN